MPPAVRRIGLDAPSSIEDMRAIDSTFGDEWVRAVRSVCDPVFASADVNFIAQVIRSPHGIGAILWEAEPGRYASRYPESGVVESYGSGWPPPCIDFWAYIDAIAQRALLRPEGLDEISVDLVRDGLRDGLAIAREFARVLGVAAPRDPDRDDA